MIRTGLAADIQYMTLAKNTDKCPYCKEPIVYGASRCKHCHADLSESVGKGSFWSRYNCFRTGFLCGILFTLVIVVLAYFHFTSGN